MIHSLKLSMIKQKSLILLLPNLHKYINNKIVPIRANKVINLPKMEHLLLILIKNQKINLKVKSKIKNKIKKITRIKKERNEMIVS